MKALHFLFDKEWKTKLLLFLVSFFIYFIYFHYIFFNINTILSSITSDTIKNYFTFFYHIKNDNSVLHFGGMAYPYGEHVVYTDCQPLLTFVLRALPFTHQHLIGILHSLIFLSFIITPVILYNIFRLFELDKFSSFLCGLAVGLLSPQFLKINAGHHALAYACMIPYSIFLITKYYKVQNNKILVSIFFYHCGLFLIHPYMGFSISLFSAMVFLSVYLLSKAYKLNYQKFMLQITVSVLPVFLFKLFMILTDKHPDRTTEPYGLNVMVENLDSLLAPVFGPMKSIMEVFFNHRPEHYEGHTYLGIFTILLFILFIVTFPFILKKIKLDIITISLLFASLVLLFISFGWHTKVFDFLGFNISFMNQFRASCRFAWFFYYALAVFLVVTFYHYLKALNFSPIKNKILSVSFPVLFLTCNLWEANYMFKLDEGVFWKFRNIFNVTLLNREEQNNLQLMHSKNVQAIVPLPLFESGSEMYDRTGFNSSMIPSMLYASHSGIPILSAMMSRTSISETKEIINLLNSYKINRPALALLNEGDFFIIKTEKEILPDEERLFSASKIFSQNDSLQFAFINKNNFLKRKLDSKVVIIENRNILQPDSNQIIYLSTENRPPFKETSMDGFTSIFKLDSNQIKGGKFSVSFRYYYILNNYHALACDLIITEKNKQNYVWKYMVPLRILSGFYNGFAIFETSIELDKNKEYEFLIAGREKRKFNISNFMLRPLKTSVLVKTIKNDTTFNNYLLQ